MIRTQPTAATIRDIMNEGPHGRRGWLHDILITAFDEAVREFEAGNDPDKVANFTMDGPNGSLAGTKKDHGINGVARQKDVQKLQKRIDILESYIQFTGKNVKYCEESDTFMVINNEPSTAEEILGLKSNLSRPGE